MAPKVAFITGGNGITGSAILEYLVKNTTSEQWSKIIVTSRSPFATHLHDPRVVFIALDFSKPPTWLIPQMRDTCAPVTHSYFSSYVHRDDFAQLNAANTSLFENFLNSLTLVAPDLQNVTLQTGGKYYYLHLRPVPTPTRESDPRQPATVDNFYFPQEDFLAARQKEPSSKWTYNVIRPQAVIGSTNVPNGMNCALTIALYMLTCRELGQPAPMPTNQIYWSGADDMSFAPLVADLSIFVSTHPRCANEAFNCVNGDHFVWRYMWPRICAWFGIISGASAGSTTPASSSSSEQIFHKPPPAEGSLQQELTFLDWSADKRDVWNRLCSRTGSEKAKGTWDFGTWAFQDWVFRRSWTATLSINKARKFGWDSHVDSFDCLVETWEKFERLGLIPPVHHGSFGG